MRLITLSDVKLSLGKGEEELVKLATKKLGKKPAYFAIKRKSLDARNKSDVKFVYTIEFSDEKQPPKREEIERLPISKQPKEKVLVVGSGPAGLFCALRLLERGIVPIVIERGASVEERERKINAFCLTGILDTETNVQFGEGGAGTFSDGKLNTQTHSPLIGKTLETFVRFGAPEEILWLNKPHIGSDKLKTVVKNMREYIRNQGGEVRFHTKLSDITVQDGRLVSVTLIDQQTGREEKREVSAVALAIGHSARDTFERLLSKGVCMRQKDFAVGVRIEHLQKDIGMAQYGKAYSLLPAAEYKLVSHTSERAVFTFCMCPGGFVMPAASEEGGVVTNGMSNFKRDGVNANSAVIAQVRRADFSSDSPLAGVEFQRQLERAAFLSGGGTYAAPTQLVGDFLAGKESKNYGEIQPTYGAGTRLTDFKSIFPSSILQALQEGVLDMDKRLHGFARPDAVLTAAETRTSSPIRMERNERLQSVSVENLYPCGEGAGYAGGITSSAVDGIRVADAIYADFLENNN